MQQYETMFVTSTTLDEQEHNAIVERVKSLIEANGTIAAVDEWGRRRLAYPINKETDGVYTLIYFTSDTDFPAELSRVYNINEGILRSLIIAQEHDNLPEQKEEATEPVEETADEKDADEQPAETASDDKEEVQ